MVFVSIVLELFALLALVAGVRRSTMHLIYLSVGASAVVAMLLVASVVRGRTPRAAGAEVAPPAEKASLAEPAPTPTRASPGPPAAPASPLATAATTLPPWTDPPAPWPCAPVGEMKAPGAAALGRLRRRPQVGGSGSRRQLTALPDQPGPKTRTSGGHRRPAASGRRRAGTTGAVTPKPGPASASKKAAASGTKKASAATGIRGGGARAAGRSVGRRPTSQARGTT
ncbi:MAG: hypothetical protein LC708_03560, partial [Actinobacteria bacterium]|nr:hypothetical protein [Actinomycetota bacterium]